MCDRKTISGQPAIGAYLSGGFDSSTIVGLLSRIYPGKLHTFSIGFENAPDLLAARKVADYVGSQHHEVVVTEDEMLELLHRVPKIIESYDVTTNRASAFMLKLSEYIRDKTDIIVVYSGEGSDELFGSYLYFHLAPDPEAFKEETIRLVHDLQYFDLLRGDKSSAAAGLEIRVPFLDIDFVEYVKTIPPSLKMHKGIEKYILRKAISDIRLIPSEICWRTKEAMSDGVSVESRSWSTIIQDHVFKENHRSMLVRCQPIHSRGEYVHDLEADKVQMEKEWFKRAFSHAYPGCEGTIPYDWLPKWCDIKDSSARALKLYKQLRTVDSMIQDRLRPGVK
jgi:asparagine synthase (glutamine-hydrolysing)